MEPSVYFFIVLEPQFPPPTIIQVEDGLKRTGSDKELLELANNRFMLVGCRSLNAPSSP